MSYSIAHQQINKRPRFANKRSYSPSFTEMNFRHYGRMKTKFPDELIYEYIAMMHDQYGVTRTQDEAEHDLDSLGDLFLLFAESVEVD